MGLPALSPFLPSFLEVCYHSFLSSPPLRTKRQPVSVTRPLNELATPRDRNNTKDQPAVLCILKTSSSERNSSLFS